MYKNYLKRVLDFVFSFLALVLFGWLLILVAICLFFANKGAGVFFVQQRPGKNGRLFKLIKFKSMTDQRGEDGKLLPDSQRITKIGKLLRATSIDELPQLINVFLGDMSFIGPRPLLVKYLPLYTAEQMRRHEVRPGITGWAQVNGRNHCLLSKKFKYDVWYVDHCSFVTDIRIVFYTIRNVLQRKDIGEGNGEMSQIDDLNFMNRLNSKSNQQ